MESNDKNNMFGKTTVTMSEYTTLKSSTSFVLAGDKSNPADTYTNIDLVVLATVVGIMFVFGIVSNGLTIYVIYQSVALKSVFNYFIWSLSISDLMSALVSPLFLYKSSVGFRNWALPHFMCKVFWSVDMGTSVLTSLHIFVFAALRYVSLKWPHKFTRLTLKQAKGVILFLWLVSVGGGFVPFAIWIDVRERFKTSIPACALADFHSVKQFRIYAVVGYIIFFYIPCLLIIGCSVRVSLLLLFRRIERVKKLRERGLDQNEVNRQKKENQAILQLILIVGSFLLGYLPSSGFHIYIMLSTRKSSNKHLHWWLGIGVHLALRLSECLNPVFYNLTSNKIRGETKKCLRKIFSCCTIKQNRPQQGKRRAQTAQTIL